MRVASFVFFLISLLCLSCSPDLQKIRGNVFGTTYGIQYFDELPNVRLERAVDSTYRVINESLSTYLPNSVISQINHNQDVVVDDLFVKVFEASNVVFRETNGRFDPTIGALVNIWDFGPEGAIRQVDSTQIRDLMSHVGFNRLQLNEYILQKPHESVFIDFNAIAKGFAVDQIAELLSSFGYADYLVEIGGEIRTSGMNRSKNSTWKIGVDKPNFEGNQSVIAAIELDNTSMATSGVYRHFKVNEQGERYAHIIDSKTGFPTRTDILSVSVIAKECMFADAYATAIQSMNSAEAKAFLSVHPELKVMLIVGQSDGSMDLQYFNGFPKN